MLKLVCKLLVFLADGLDYLGKVQQLVKLLRVEEVGQALAPAVFELNQDLHKLNVVLELWVDHFDVLLILAQEVFEVLESLLNPFGEAPNRFGLRRADTPENPFGCQQDLTAEVVSAHAFGVGY